jgi:hypothetical protein
MSRALWCHFPDDAVANRELAKTHLQISNRVVLRAAGLTWNSWIQSISLGVLNLPAEAGVIVLVQEHDGKSSMVDDDGGPLLLHLTGMQLQRLVTAVITSQSTMRWDEFTQAWQNFPEGLRMLRLFVVGFMTALAAQELAEDAVSQLHVSSETEPLVSKSELDEMCDGAGDGTCALGDGWCAV